MMNEKQDGHPEEALSAYLDGELEPAERAAIEEHLQGCAACAGLLEDLRHLDAAAAEELPPPVPADLAGRISRQLAPPRVVEMPERRLAVKRWFGPIPLAAAATLAAVAILATVRLVAPLAVRGPAAPVPVADEALRPAPKEKGAAEVRDAAREHRAAGEREEPQEPGWEGATADERVERLQRLNALGGRGEGKSPAGETDIGQARQAHEPPPPGLKARAQTGESQASGYVTEGVPARAPAGADRETREKRVPEVAYETDSAAEKKGAPSHTAGRDAGAPTEGAAGVEASVEERPRLSRSRVAPADAAAEEGASSRAQRLAEVPPPSPAPVPKREKGQGAATPSAGVAAPEPTPSAPSKPDHRPGAAPPLPEAALEESAASEDDQDTARSLAAPERFGAEAPEPGTLSVLGETEGPREVRMLRTGAIVKRTLILETPGYRIAVTEDGNLEVHAAGYRCAVDAEAPAEEGRRAAGELTSARPVAEKAGGVPAEIADLFRLAGLLREASEKDRSREDRDAAKEAAESPWTISLVGPAEPLFRIDASADRKLIDAGSPRDEEARGFGNVVAMHEGALQNESARRYLATWLAERILTLARRDYASLIQAECGPLPDSLASGN